MAFAAPRAPGPRELQALDVFACLAAWLFGDARQPFGTHVPSWGERVEAQPDEQLAPEQPGRPKAHRCRGDEERGGRAELGEEELAVAKRDGSHLPWQKM